MTTMGVWNGESMNINKAYITVIRDPSVGIPDINFDITLYDIIQDYDKEEREGFRKSIIEWVKGWFDDKCYVLFDDECPDCGTAGHTDGICVNPNCIQNISEHSGDML